MTTTAITRNVHVSSRKANLVCRLIRGKKVAQALIILQNCHKKTAYILSKLLGSAIANAINNHAMNGDVLYVYSCVANQGRTIKRVMPRAKGSSNMIRKRHSHLVITLSDDPNQKPLIKKNKSKPKHDNLVAKPSKSSVKPVISKKQERK